MSQNFVADDLWVPCNQEESVCDLKAEWLCDFCFHPGLDIIEENALNERSCVQVLRILIAAADIEIEELEKELVSLQTELAWAEDEEWSDICCSVLREKVKCLDASLRNMKNQDEDSIEFYLLMHTEPVSKLQDLLKALLESFWQKRDKDVIFSHTSSDSPAHKAEVLHRNQNLGIPETNTSILEEETEGPSYSLKQNYAFSNTFNELQVKKTNGSRTPVSSDAKELNPSDLELAACNHDSEAITDQQSRCSEGAKDKTATFVGKEVFQHIFSKSAPKRIHDQEKHEQNTKLVMDRPDEDKFVCQLNKKRRLGAYDLTIVKKEKEDIAEVNLEDVITLKPLPKLENMVPLCNDTKIQNRIHGLESIPSTHNYTANHSTERQQLSKPELEGQTRTTAATGENRKDLSAVHKSKLSKASSAAEYKKIFLKDDKDWFFMQPANHTVVNSDSFDTSRNGAGLGGSRNNHDLNREEAHLDYDMDKKLSDFVSESTNKKLSKNGVISKCFANPFSKEGGKMKEAHGTEGSLANAEQSALSSLLPKQEAKETDSTTQLLEEGKPNVAEIQLDETIATCTNHGMDSQTGKQTEKEKMNAGSNLITARESTGCIPNPSSVSVMVKYSNDLNPVSSLSEKKMTSDAVDGQTSTSGPRKASKKCSSSPIFFKVKGSTFLSELFKSWGSPVDITGKAAFSLSKFHSNESSMELTRPVPARNLKDMKMCDLRTIAKELNLTGYSKLKKIDLIELIMSRLSCQVP